MREAKDLVEDYIERVWNGGEPDALDELTAPGFTYQLGGQPPRDVAAMKGFLAELREAFPDWNVRIETIVGEGDVVAVRWTGTATHAGVFRGIPATGRNVVAGGMNFYLLKHGRIAREWEQMDSLGLLAQLGVLDAD